MGFRIALVVVMCSISAGAHAGSQYGVKAGACLAERSASYVEDGVGLVELEHSRQGACVGLFGHWYGSSRLGLLAEVQYVQKGITDIDGEPVDCLCFPVMPRYDAHLGRGRLYVALGPRLDMYLESDESMSSAEFGVDAVLGYQLGRVSLETRYSGTPERDEPPGGVDSSGDVFQAQLGWTFWSDRSPRHSGVSEPPN